MIVNISKAILSFSVGLIIARGLGPSEYGTFAFLLASFAAFLQLLDMGSSSAFYTLMSRKIRSKIFIRSYGIWLSLQFGLSLLFLAFIVPNDWLNLIWHGEARERVIIAFVAVFFQRQVWNFLAQLGEAQRLTKKIQAINLLIAIVHILIIGVCYYLKILSIDFIFTIIFIEFLIAMVIVYFYLPVQVNGSEDSLSSIFEEFKNYCIPLIPYAWLGMLMVFADTWLLQNFSGPVEQAYYAVGAQFASVSLIATISVLRILWKEVAAAHEDGNIERVHFLFLRTSKPLFQMSAILTGFLLPWTTDIISITLGEEYLGGVITLQIMFLYPIHQSLGQVVGSSYLALGHTKAYSSLSALGMILSIIAAYFTLATSTSFIPGLGLGAAGLAIKMVVVQIINVNILLWWLSRKMSWKYEWIYQLWGMVQFLALGFLSHLIVILFLDNFAFIGIKLFFGLLLYIVIVILVIALLPQNFGFTKEELWSSLGKYFSKFTNNKT